MSVGNYFVADARGMADEPVVVV